MLYLGYVLPGGGKVQEVLPPPLRKSIAHGRLNVWIRESSNDTVSGVSFPRCVGTIGSGKIR